jgi:hypothetical protein
MTVIAMTSEIGSFGLDVAASLAATVEQVADVLRPLWRGPAAGSGARLRQLMEHVFRAAGVKGEPKKFGRVFTVSSTRTGAINKDGLLKHLREYRTVETVHGVRASFGSWAEDARFMPDVIEASLAHEKGDNTAKAYRRSKLLPARRELMDAWAAFARAG